MSDQDLDNPFSEYNAAMAAMLADHVRRTMPAISAAGAAAAAAPASTLAPAPETAFVTHPMRKPVLSLLPADIDVRYEWDAQQSNVLRRSPVCLELRHRTIPRQSACGEPIFEGPQILVLRNNSDGSDRSNVRIKDVESLVTALHHELGAEAPVPRTLVVTPEVAAYIVRHDAFLGINARFMVSAFDESRARRDPDTGRVLWYIGLTAYLL
jgi:hypothetical protein